MSEGGWGVEGELPPSDGWWKASDGRWYPPDTTPRPEPPAGQPSQPGSPPRSRRGPLLFAGAAALAAVAVVAVILALTSGGDDDETVSTGATPTPTSVPATEAPFLGSTPAPAGTTNPEGTQPTTVLPTASPTVSPTPTAAPATALGSRGSPYPVGTTATLAFESFQGGGGSVIWEVTVEEPARDITAEVMAENQFNDPPIAGRAFFGLRLTTRLVASDVEPLTPLADLSFGWLAPVSLRAFGLDFPDDYCGVIPDELTYTEVFVGGEISGTLCVSLPLEDIAAEPLLIVTTGFEDDHYFATSG